MTTAKPMVKQEDTMHTNQYNHNGIVRRICVAIRTVIDGKNWYLKPDSFSPYTDKECINSHKLIHIQEVEDAIKEYITFFGHCPPIGTDFSILNSRHYQTEAIECIPSELKYLFTVKPVILYE